MKSKSQNKMKQRKYNRFHRNWKKILKEKQQIISSPYKQQLLIRTENNNDDEQKEKEINIVVPFSDQLKSWALANRISMSGLDSLLTILKANGHTELPKSYRTLLQTPRQIDLRSLSIGEYWYRGLTACLNIAFLKLDRDLSVRLIFNVDGLPIFNSSQLQFWPILASVKGLY